MTGSVGRQFLMLIWKNYKIQRQRPATTVFQILIPVCLSGLLLAIRIQIGDLGTLCINATRYPSATFPILPNIQRAWFFVNPNNPNKLKGTSVLAYTPDNPTVKRIMERVSKSIDLEDPNQPLTLLGFSTEQKLVDFITSFINYTHGGVVFTSDFTNGNKLPRDIKYKLRLIRYEGYWGRFWRTGMVFEERYFQFALAEQTEVYIKNPRKGVGTGFLLLQYYLDQAIIQELNNTATFDDLEVEFRRHPYPEEIHIFFQTMLPSWLPLILMFSFIINGVLIVKDLVQEKEQKLKETMKMMGLRNWLLWLTWFLHHFIMMLICSVIIVVILIVPTKKGSVLIHTDGTLLFVYLLFYITTIIIFCFMIASIFSKANPAAAASFVLLFFTCVPYLAIKEDELEFVDKIALCLLPNTAMSLGVRKICTFEKSGMETDWTNFYEPTAEDRFTLGHVFLMFFVDIILYGLIIWWMDAVFPGDYGVPKPLYFFLMKSYWCGDNTRKVEPEEYEEAQVPLHTLSTNYEPNPPNHKAGVRIRNLRKVFKKRGNNIVAVNDMSLDMLKNQITALLGHNGAGKTTTMFMLTGFIPPTSGTCYINGKDIKTNMSQVRESLGLCPQHNVLFDALTIREHLYFFARLKGVSSSDVEKEVNRMLDVLHIKHKSSSRPDSLSGGMKRKLSVGIALIGGSKIVILDEPTSGMDPQARRQMWDILQAERHGRTILLSTHFMDEADILGDRIAIMVAGKVHCCGSSLFLKKKYGVGYHLVLVKTGSCDINVVTKLVHQFVPAAKLESNVSSELSYSLPSESAVAFQELFTILENDHERLGIESFGASVTTLEEVFFKVGMPHLDETDKAALQLTAESNSVSLIAGKSKTSMPLPFPSMAAIRSPPSYCTLIAKQYRGLIVKRMLYSLRHWWVTMMQLIVPVLMTFCLVLYAQAISETGQQEPRLLLDTSMFVSPKILYSNDSGLSADLAASLVSTIKSQAAIKRVDKPGIDGIEALEDKLLQIGSDNMGMLIRKHIVSFSFQNRPKTNEANASVLITGLYNDLATHSPAVVVSLLGNLLLDYYVPGKGHRIHVTNHPPPPLPEEDNTNDSAPKSEIFVEPLLISFGLSFMASTFILFLVTERSVKAKHCQFLSGVHPITYWMATFLWDLINYLLQVLIVMGVLYAFHFQPYTDGVNLQVTSLVLIMYGLSVLPYIYLWSLELDLPSLSFVIVFSLLICLGMVTAMYGKSLVGTKKKVWQECAVMAFTILMPSYNLIKSLMIIMMIHSLKICVEDRYTDGSFCSNLQNETDFCCPGKCGNFCYVYEHKDLNLEEPYIGGNVLAMGGQCILFFTALILYESGHLGRLKKKISDFICKLICRRQVRDEVCVDLTGERARLQEMDEEILKRNNPLVVLDLDKWFGGFHAVKKLNLAVPKGECFGLLGVNGAGKTTTFRMLTGDEIPSAGNAYILGYNILSQLTKAQKQIGYCPQFDGLNSHLTVKETLRMIGHFRGIPSADIPDMITKLTESLLLKEHINQRVHDLSGGNKRKLSTAIALIGDPPVVFLDEPTTGMDPEARRHVWNVLSDARSRGTTLVLTTHSMEEGEALCTRIAIMVNGQFQCMGSVQQLKNSFGKGYTLIAKLKQDAQGTEDSMQTRMNEFKTFIQSQYAKSEVKDCHSDIVQYHIPADAKVTWSQLFGLMEKIKEQFQLEDYSVSQTTLEQVFINLARNQKPLEKKDKNVVEVE